ncbi:CASP-like protein 1D1 [Phalaenopsis equestris]|uniref:CASP-like protein 1D1 n=1 Tax=Phalaenopsis equestris TaxID=78828 RepID=UPI0009E3E317|nr:CASP-like protein 1D1 [Phalaenopsis equestris]
MESGYGASPARFRGFPGGDFALRLLLFATSLSALVVLATSKQSKSIPVPISPQLTINISRSAKFSHSPALIYLLVALSATTLYSIISLIISATSFRSKSFPSSSKLFRLMVLDLLMGGIMAAATGSAGSVAYIGLKGNSHVLWNKICNIFDEFCRHVGSSTLLSLIASALLFLLVLLSAYSIYRRSH